jgi:hypothetical protein
MGEVADVAPVLSEDPIGARGAVDPNVYVYTGNDRSISATRSAWNVQSNQVIGCLRVEDAASRVSASSSPATATNS